MRCRKNTGRVLAGILAVGLLVSSVPSAVYAVENESGTAVVAEQEEPVSEETGEEAEQENAGTDPVGKEDNESGEETADPTDNTPEEEDKGKQEEPAADSEQTEGDDEAGNAREVETKVEADVKVVAAEVMEADEAETSGSCGENLTWRYADGVLTISGSGAMYDYTYDYSYNYQGYVSSAPWNIYQEAIECVVIEDSITTIGDYAFCDCSRLTSIELPSEVILIGESAFRTCSSLSSIEIPSRITTIEAGTFWGCFGLTNIELPSGVISIGEFAFFDCRSLTSIELPSGVTTIEAGTFSGCFGLTNIELPSRVTTIGNSAFVECRSLNSIEIPSGVTTIGEYAFRGCNSLSNIEIPSGVTTIEAGTFFDCSSLTNIELPSGVTTIGVEAFSGCRNLSSIEIPSGVTTIGVEAFLGCSSLSSIEIPSGVTAIAGMTFLGCSSLSSIEIPSGVTTIGGFAFEDCSSLTSIDIPTGVTTIAWKTFLGCSSLSSIEIPSGVTTIKGYAFFGCSSLSSIEIPSGVTTIEGYTFTGCSSLTDIYYGGSESDWLSITIGDYNEPLTTATIHYNSTGSGTGDKPKPPINPDPDVNDDPTLIVRQRTFDFTDPGTVQLIWGWNYILNRNSSDYIHEISTVALALSAAAGRSQSAVETMLTGDNFGVDKVKSVNYDEATQEVNHPACTFAHKEINNGGKTEHIIVIVGRGTVTDADKYTDLCSIVDHFDEPASNIWRSFLGWLDTNELSDKINSSNTKFFVTGHSLGGAVANRIAYRLTRDYGNSNVYAYTFGTPPTEGQSSTTVPNIFNVLCVGDQVPYAGVFTDGRYGNECWFEEFCAFPTDVFNNFDNHVVESYMKHLLNRHDNKFRTTRKSGGGWCPVDLRIYNSSGQLVGSVTNNVVDKENITDSVMIVLSGEDHDKKNFYFLIDDTYTIEFTGTSEGTLKYTIRDTYADKSRIDEKVFTNVTLTTGKQMTSSVSVWDKTDPSINIDDKIDTPQVQLIVLDENGNAVKEVLPDGKGTEVPYTGPIEVLPKDIPADGKIPEGLWIAGVKDSYIYTGAAIKPEIRVYDGKKRLQPGKDYTVSYKNNTKVNNAAQSSTAPTITVKGKGNYAGSETATFQITAVDLSDSVVLAEDLTVAYNKKVQKKVPVVTYNGKKLALNRDFTVSYPNGGDGAYKEAGTYDILLTAKSGGNFSGTSTVKCTITDNTLLSKVTVKKIPTQVYTGEAIEPELTVTYKGAPLAKDTDYSVRYTDNTEIGTAKAILTGIGKYAGTKSVSFSITGTSLSGASVSGIENKIYNGNDQEQRFTVTLKGKTLTEGTDYDVLYEKNKNVGKANVTIKGKGAYTGTVKKTFTIGKFNVAANADGRFEVKLKQDVVPYAKGGAKPEVTVRFKTGNEKWNTLTEGQDYTLSYRNHTAVNDGSNQNKQPVVTVKGKGSFSGTYGTALTYKIVAQDLGQLRLTAQDKTYQNKKNVYATKITITDLDGKVLKPGTDYNKVLTYSYANDTPVNKNDIIPAGTILKVQADAKGGGNYTGSLTGEYRMTQAAISSASISVPKQIYTGRAITLEKNQITVKIIGKRLDESQYEIVPDSYKNNVKKGTAAVTIRGLDNYGGTKDVKFTIKAKGFLWWWR